MRERVLSGMRPSGRLHLGHYHGVLANWLKLLDEGYECFFFVADWHALTTEYENPRLLKENILEMVTDWLSCGIDPEKSIMFLQSGVKEHAELHLLLSMITPLPWLERNPTYKEQIAEVKDRELHTYGFLGYPGLQTSHILVFLAQKVPVGIDQAQHLDVSSWRRMSSSPFNNGSTTGMAPALASAPRVLGTD